MRAFIGVEFTEGVKQNIMDMQRIIRNDSIRGRWKYISNFHLTLKFLGEVSEESAFSIYEKMKERLQGFQCFDLKCGGIGYFRGSDSLRVIYLGFDGDIAKLEKLFNIVEDSCSECGVPKEFRKYTPHITIAQDVVLHEDFRKLEDKLRGIYKPTVKVREISIIKSEQVNGKRIYTTVLSIPLSAAYKSIK